MIAIGIIVSMYESPTHTKLPQVGTMHLTILTNTEV